jgi:hypothetical protein
VLATNCLHSHFLRAGIKKARTGGACEQTLVSQVKLYRRLKIAEELFMPFLNLPLLNGSQIYVKKSEFVVAEINSH